MNKLGLSLQPCKPAISEQANTAATDVTECMVYTASQSCYHSLCIQYPLVCVHCGPVVDFFITKQTCV